MYQALMEIEIGTTVSYASLARRAGIPGGARFAGTTMAKNMFPLLIPCHRVIRSDGSMGGFSGAMEIKRFLLEHEKGAGNHAGGML